MGNLVPLPGRLGIAFFFFVLTPQFFQPSSILHLFHMNIIRDTLKKNSAWNLRILYLIAFLWLTVVLCCFYSQNKIRLFNEFLPAPNNCYFFQSNATHLISPGLLFGCLVCDWYNFLYFPFWKIRQLFPSFFKTTALLRYNLYSILLIHLICVSQWFLM